jgi:hypothetical protein
VGLPVAIGERVGIVGGGSLVNVLLADHNGRMKKNPRDKVFSFGEENYLFFVIILN